LTRGGAYVSVNYPNQKSN